MLDKNAWDYLRKFKKLALAVSGGKDSMYLLNLFVQNREELPDFFVVNVNHNLRGEESDRDSSFVKQFCQEHAVECVYYDEDISSYCRQNGYGIEQGARLRRREIFAQIVALGKAQRVVTAHHMDDQAESVLMHVFRGSGIKGLCGMSIDDGMLIRPLLNVSSSEIVEKMQLNGWDYVVDSTNEQTDYSRNKIRHEIMPLIQEIYPSAVANISRLAQTANMTQQFLDKYLVEFKVDQGDLIFPLSLFDRRDIVATGSIFAGLDKMGWRVDFEQKHIELLYTLARKNVGARLDLPWGVTAYKEQDKIVLTSKKDIEIVPRQFGIGVFDMGEWRVEITDMPTNNCLRADKDVLDGSILRVRHAGDKFAKFGGGTKSLGDFLTDKKVPLRERGSLIVIAKENDVLVVLPIEISSKVAINENTKNICYIKAYKNTGENNGNYYKTTF